MSDKISSFFSHFFSSLPPKVSNCLTFNTFHIHQRTHCLWVGLEKKTKFVWKEKDEGKGVRVEHVPALPARVFSPFFLFKEKERKKMRSFHAEAVYLCNHPPPLPNESLRQSRDSTRYLRNQGGGSQRPIFSWYWVWYVYTRLCGNPGSPSLSLSSTIFFYMDVHYYCWCSGGVVITISCWWPRYFRASLYGCLSLLASCCCLMIVCACVWCVCIG